MKILALEKEVPGVRDEAFTVELLRREAARAWELYQAGSIREMYFRSDRTEAVLLLECTSVAEAETILSSLPLVRSGLIAFECIPLKPYDGFARLFSPTL